MLSVALTEMVNGITHMLSGGDDLAGFMPPVRKAGRFWSMGREWVLA